MNHQNFIGGIILGVMAGAVAGVLFAPHKGSVTRRKITKNGTELADSLKNKMGDMIDDIVSKYEVIEEEYSATKEKVSH